MAKTGFDLELLRLELARGLPASCFEDFQRLVRTLLHGPAFQWLLVDAADEQLRRQVMAALDKVLVAAGLRTSHLPLGRKIVDVATLEQRLIRQAIKVDVVHVLGPHGWFDAKRWDEFNVRRERLASRTAARLVFWLDAEAIALASHGAPDLWAWRGGVYVFAQSGAVDLTETFLPAATDSPRLSAREGVDGRSMVDRHRRVAEIRAWMQAHPDAPDDLMVAPLDELGRLLFDLGDYDGALAHWQGVELPFHQRRGSEHAAAVTWGRIADVLEVRGELKEALGIRIKEQLPVFARLEDLRGAAIAAGKVAEILETQGQLDEALQIRESQLSAFARLGDDRWWAIAKGRIAAILVMRGQLDEALRIWREEQIPVYERLGETRLKAVTQGRIADVLRARGEIDESLRIRREQLSVFERLGDVRERAVTQGKIAELLRIRGQYEESLRILQEDVLPVFLRLGDKALVASTYGKCAEVYFVTNELDKALSIWRNLVLPNYKELGDLDQIAITQGKIADILEARGHLDEALRIRREEELPVYERLGNARELAVTQVKIAMHLLRHSDQRGEAETLLRQAHNAFSTMGLPEADHVAGLMHRHNMLP